MSTISAVDPILLTRRVRTLISQGHLGAARPLIAALRLVAPAAVTTGELDAELLLGEGHVADAIDCLDRAILATPGEATLRLCRADARLRGGDILGAAGDAAEAVVLEPRNPAAKAILGIVLTATDRTEDAIICLREVVDEQPYSASFRQALAKAQSRAADHAAASQTLREGIARVPGSLALRIDAIAAAMQQRDFDEAVLLAEAARKAGLADARLFSLLGHALFSLTRTAEAGEAYGEALKLAPDDQYIAHLVRTVGSLPQTARAPNAYVETVFDGYAARFEAHLISLGYRVPGLIRAALLASLPPMPPNGPSTGPLLDLGCGTGLVAVALSDLPIGPLVGVDISGIMLQQATAKSLYAELLQIDLEVMLADESRSWAIITASDVLCYFGDLDSVFAAALARLRPGGLFILSVEHLREGDAGWTLTERGRYAHTADYIAGTAARAGFVVRVLREEALRLEDHCDVAGLLVVLERAP
jgi:predicted TPR repeat methyltransferase